MCCRHLQILSKIRLWREAPSHCGNHEQANVPTPVSVYRSLHRIRVRRRLPYVSPDYYCWWRRWPWRTVRERCDKSVHQAIKIYLICFKGSNSCKVNHKLSSIEIPYIYVVKDFSIYISLPMPQLINCSPEAVAVWCEKFLNPWNSYQTAKRFH